MGYSPRGHKESDMTERLYFHFTAYLGIPLTLYIVSSGEEQNLYLR